MIFSYVSTKDLICSLPVSKHWQRSILSSIILRRRLLLDWDPRNEYLSYGKHTFVLSNKPILTNVNKLIHAPHPVLLPYSKSDLWFDLEITDIPYEVLRSVHPATFLFQPPLNHIQLFYEDYTAGAVELIVKREGGVTFGELLEELDEMRKLRRDSDGVPGDVCTHCHTRVIASNANNVMDARAARAMTEASAGLDSLE